MTKVTGRQLRMARVSMKFRVDDLSKKADVSWARVQHLERSDDVLEQTDKVEKLINFFEANNIVFYEGNEVYYPYIKIKK